MSRLVLPDKPRILVITLRRIGDALLTTPLIRSLRRAFPQATTDVLVYDGIGRILSGNPDINNLITMPQRPSPGETLALARRLFRQYDLAISTQSGDRPTFFAIMAGRRSVSIVEAGGLKGMIKKFLLTRSAPYDDTIYRVEQMLRLADALGLPRVPEVVAPVAGAQSIVARGERYAVIHAAPMYRYKEWTAEGWRALAVGLTQRGLKIVAIAGPGDAERKYLDGVWHGTIPIHQLDWPQNTALLESAALYVGPDTSVTHLAAATGCPTVALFGPTDPQLWGPWPKGGITMPWKARGTIQNRGNVWLVQNPLPCLPCQYEGCDRHVGSHSQCLDELQAQYVLAAADQALASRRAA
ncbi:MAG: glycosyltransferase family 9 protein [Pseudolabrys sp.]|nr:glycosyltransferase family 9 protein [Pseudolabrys sp.]MBV9261054.1 glycosyltransferase family 9 protein [Pseudolabrys sp.]